MEAIHISYVAILVAVVANFIVGFVWYTPLFGKAWAKEMKLDITRKPTAAELGKGMTFMIIGNFLMAWVFVHNIGAWNFVPGTAEAPPAANLISSAVFTWLGFFVPTDLSVVAWEGKSWKLFFINTGYHLITLFVAAAIIMNM